MVSGPDLEALVVGVQRLSESFDPSDPVYQEMLATSVTMAETYLIHQPGETEDDPSLVALRAMQLGVDLSPLQLD